MTRPISKSVLGGLKSVETLHGPQHPSNNMGAQITDSRPLENRVLIDWFAFTILNEMDPKEVIKKTGLDKLDFTESKSGGMGYKKSMRAGNIVIFYDGAENMGCHVSLTGQGCRQFEAIYTESYRWITFMILLTDLGANFGRIDIAIDNVDGLLDLDLLEECINNKQIRSRFKSGHKIENFTFAPDDHTPQGKTLYVGSPASRLKFRFYDKAAQMKLDGHWVRAEIQCRAERSEEAVRLLLTGIEVGKLATSVINNYFQPINIDDSNRSRCSVQDWWKTWIEHTEKLKLSRMKAIRMIDEVVQHIQKQYSASFAMLKKFMGVVDFHEFITSLVEMGKEKLKKQHEMIIACSRLVTEPPEEYFPF